MARALLNESDESIEFSEFESAQVKPVNSEDIAKNTNEKSKFSDHKIKYENGQKTYLKEIDGSCSSSFLNDSQRKYDINELLLNIFPYSDERGKKKSEVNNLEKQCENNILWTKLQDVDCIPEPQWENSKAFQLMLQSLKIDSCNIFQTSFFPIISQLEIMNSSFLKNCISEQFEETTEDMEIFIPEAQFDWSNSGLVNPLEDELCLIDTAGLDITVNYSWNKEQNAQINFSKFPDLSFMQAKSLIFPYQRNFSLQ